MKDSIYDFLEKYSEEKTISFHMPGHKGSKIFEKYGYDRIINKIPDVDITEIYGADNLFQAEGIISNVENRYAELYDVKKTYLLINGSSGGIISAILSSVGKNEKLLMARNSHKSVYNAVNLGEIKPVYLYPENVFEYGVVGSVTVDEMKRKIEAHPDAKAIILPSPNYYGVCSDIKAISKLAHDKDMILIIDEAHGAHLKFFSKNDKNKNVFNSKENKQTSLSAVDLGADLVINSTHKTLSSFTQSAVLHVNSDKIDLSVLENYLQIIESTSPSYILMASLDICEDMLRNHGNELIYDWQNSLKKFYNNSESFEGIRIMKNIPFLDDSKINIIIDDLYKENDIPLPGNELADILREEFGIFVELVTGNVVMCMTGIGNTGKDYSELSNALKQITNRYYKNTSKNALSSIDKEEDGSVWHDEPEFKGIPKDTKIVKLKNSGGMVAANMIIPYPPGIPILCPGEMITEKHITYISSIRKSGRKVLGVDLDTNIKVGI